MEQTSLLKTSHDKSTAFVNYVISKMNDNGFKAKLKKADNPDTSYQSWEILANWIDITKDYEFQPYALIGSALCQFKVSHDGEGNIGEALKKIALQSLAGGKIEESAEAKRLQRLLACANQEELCRILRPILRLIASKSEAKSVLNFAKLLREIRYFDLNEQRTKETKLHWAQSFYNKNKEE